MKSAVLLCLIGSIFLCFSCKKDEENKNDNVDCSNENNNVSKTFDCNVQLELENVFSEAVSNEKRIFTVNNIPSHSVGEFPNNANPHSISAQDETIEINGELNFTHNSVIDNSGTIIINEGGKLIFSDNSTLLLFIKY